MTFTIRPFAPADAPAVAALFSQIQPEPVTAAELIEFQAAFPWQPGAFQALFVATDAETGQVTGYGEGWRKSWHKPGKFYVNAAVDPGCRRRGIGGALFAALEAYAAENGGTELHGEVRDNAEDDLRFAEGRGYVRYRHLFESVLDVAAFDETRFADVLAQVEREFRIFTLAEAPGEENERKLYELRKTTIPDQPAYDGSGAPTFEQWRQGVLCSSEARHDLLLIAADGDRFVGETFLRWNEPTRSMYTNYTGVLPEYRGRHLALALKVLGVRLARKFGAVTMRTNNDSENGPMLAVNRKLGYRDEPGLYFLVKQI